MPTQGLVIVASFRAKAGKEEELRARLLALVAPTRAEIGCELYDLHQDVNDPAEFLFYEIWHTRPNWDAHMQAPHLEALRSVLDDLVEAPPRIWQMKQIEP